MPNLNTAHFVKIAHAGLFKPENRGFRSGTIYVMYIHYFVVLRRVLGELYAGVLESRQNSSESWNKKSSNIVKINLSTVQDKRVHYENR